MDQILIVDHHPTDDPSVFELTTRYEIKPEWTAQALAQVDDWPDIDRIEVEARLLRVHFAADTTPDIRKRALHLLDHSMRSFHRW